MSNISGRMELFQHVISLLWQIYLIVSAPHSVFWKKYDGLRLILTISKGNQDPCGVMEMKFGLQHPRFVAWNPAVQSNRSGIEYHYDYCVSIPGFQPTFTTFTTTSTKTTSSMVQVKTVDVDSTITSVASSS